MTQDTLEAMVRDFTSVSPRAKSEVRRRIVEYCAKTHQEETERKVRDARVETAKKILKMFIETESLKHWQDIPDRIHAIISANQPKDQPQ